MAAGRTYTPIQTYSLNSDQSSIDFNNIPQSYTDLILVAVFKGTDANLGINNWFLRVNNDSNTIYSNTRLYADGSSVASNRTTLNTKWDFYAPRGNEAAQAINIVNFSNYSNSSIFKPVLWRTNITNSSSLVDLTCGLWRSTSAITSINISGANRSGSTFTLYGIAAA